MKVEGAKQTKDRTKKSKKYFYFIFFNWMWFVFSIELNQNLARSKESMAKPKFLIKVRPNERTDFKKQSIVILAILDYPTVSQPLPHPPPRPNV